MIMFKATAKYIRSVFRHLLIVVVLCGAFIFVLDRAQTSFPFIAPATITQSGDNAAFSINSENQIEKVSSKVLQQKTSLEAILPLHHLLFKRPVEAFKVVQKIIATSYSFNSQQQVIAPYVARAPGESLNSRIFPITIQTNAP